MIHFFRNNVVFHNLQVRIYIYLIFFFYDKCVILLLISAIYEFSCIQDGFGSKYLGILKSTVVGRLMLKVFRGTS